uniref:Uncharacterized protein n=1 Tax=Opuntia streptacantha TaxID=393608 RepID=A0A7C8ZSK1_OPUST
MQNPCQCKLSRSASMLLRKIFQASVYYLVLVQILPSKPRMRRQKTVFRQWLHNSFSPKKSATKRTVWNYTNAQFSAEWNYLFFNITCPKGPFHLYGSDRMNGMCPSYRVWTSL